MHKTGRLQPILLMAVFKIAVALAIATMALVRLSAGGRVAPLVLVGQIATMGFAGALLLARGHRDPRATTLGYICLLLAAAFTPSDTFGLNQRLEDPGAGILVVLANLRIELFLVPCLGLFVRDFAAPMSFPLRHRFDQLLKLSWFLATGLALAHFLWLLLAVAESGREPFADPTHRPTLSAMLLLALLALAFLVWRANRSPDDVPAKRALFDLRRLPRLNLARTLVQLMVAAPYVVLALYLYHYRHLRLVELFSSSHLTPAVCLAVGFVVFAFRHRMRDAVERHLFPEQYNSRRVLDRLPDQIRGAGDLEQLANLVEHGLTLAWRLEGAGLLVQDGGRLVDPRGGLAPLDPEARLVAWVEETKKPLEIDLESPSAGLKRLPDADRHWLVDCRVRVLAPAFALDGQLNALLVLGPKKGERPFGYDDRRQLGSICAAVGLLVELLELKQKEPERRSPLYDEMSEEILSSNSLAAECLACGRVFPPGTPLCRKCNLELAEALVPYALRRMFRFEERIGTGGMAVVYRATDLNLGRSVAIKTLPRVSPEAALHLQREARTAATVSHPGLAAIYGIETWEGTPMVILEYLENGTLGDRMGRGPLPPLEVIEIGQVVAEALAAIHTLGILHRDIKPSNIGFTRHGAAKLLDFGIARIYQDLRRDNEDPSEVLTIDGRLSLTDNVTGTLCYFSPEALDELPPDPTFDLWSLCVVLYEALTGRNLFYTPNLKDMVDAIRGGQVPDLRTRFQGCPDELAELFATELNPDKSRRAQTGKELGKRLARVRRVLSPQASGETRPPVKV